MPCKFKFMECFSSRLPLSHAGLDVSREPKSSHSDLKRTRLLSSSHSTTFNSESYANWRKHCSNRSHHSLKASKATYSGLGFQSSPSQSDFGKRLFFSTETFVFSSQVLFRLGATEKFFLPQASERRRWHWFKFNFFHLFLFHSDYVRWVKRCKHIDCRKGKK